MKEEIGKSWWDRNFKQERFRNWLGGAENPSRNALYDIVKDYKSVLDCACGVCLDWEKYQKEKLDITYKGVDSCQGLVDEAIKRGIDVVLGDIEKLPFENNEYEIVTGRHILEHLPDFEQALREMVRVASKKAVVIFFIPPGKENIGLDSKLENQVNLNTYDRGKVQKVAEELGSVEWRKMGGEELLIITK